jgi:hypothetical protein
MTIKLFDLAGERGQGESVAELQRCAEKQFQSLVGISQIAISPAIANAMAQFGLSELWHLAFELYTLSQRNVLNQNNYEAQTIIANGGYPFTFVNGLNFNAPNFAQCGVAQVSCTAPLDNISFGSTTTCRASAPA